MRAILLLSFALLVLPTDAAGVPSVTSFMPHNERFYVSLPGTLTADEVTVVCHAIGATVPTHLHTTADLEALLPVMRQDRYWLQMNVTRQEGSYRFTDELGVDHELSSNLWSSGEAICTSACGVMVNREVKIADSSDTVTLEALPRDITSNAMCVIDPGSSAFQQSTLGQFTGHLGHLIDSLMSGDVSSMNDALTAPDKALKILLDVLQSKAIYTYLETLGNALDDHEILFKAFHRVFHPDQHH